MQDPSQVLSQIKMGKSRVKFRSLTLTQVKDG